MVGNRPMLLHDDGRGTVCIGQAAHSWVSGQLARQWGNERFAAPEPLAEVCLGAEQHDVGWAGWDRRPELDPDTGYPYPFTRVSKETKRTVWTDAPQRMLTQSPYAALLVSMHGTALAEGDPGERTYVDEQLALQADLMERIGEDPERARRNQRLVWVVDYLALVGLIPRWAPATQATPDGDIEVTVGGPCEVVVDPWPFAAAGPIEIAYPGRRLTEPSATTEQLHASLDAAPWTGVTVRWQPR